jgi:DNA-binding GntR family transcriptional regulator
MAQPRCICFGPVAVRLWEQDILLCARHAREWLRSDEKRACVEAIEAGDGERASREIQKFIGRIAAEVPWRIRAVETIRSWIKGDW